jgi:formylglycine-generating enzyme required for sulfatase activity
VAYRPEASGLGTSTASLLFDATAVAGTDAIHAPDANPTMPVDFVAYYPWTASATASGILSLDVSGQDTCTTEASFNQLDALFARTEQPVSYKKGRAVPLHFRHKMALLVLRLNSTEEAVQKDGLSLAAGSTVELQGFPSKASLDLFSGQLTASDVAHYKAAFAAAGSYPTGGPNGLPVDSAFFKAIIPAHDLAAFAGHKLLITPASGLTYEVDVDAAFGKISRFEEGKRYTLRLTLDRKADYDGSGEIGGWDDGDEEVVIDPTPPESKPLLRFPLPDGTQAGTQVDLRYSLVPGSTNSKDSFKVNFIPKQTFTMGGAGQYNGDNPAHRVTLSKSYYFSPYQVTNAQFATFLNDQGVGSDGIFNGVQIVATSASLDNGSYDWGLTYNAGRWMPVSGYDLHPIIYVDWEGANAYAAWLTTKLGTKISGYKVTLPTDAQWECAYRAGTAASGEGSIYPWGSTWDDQYGWVSTNSGGQTHEVGTATSSGWGLYDMAGNVWEWCMDWYDSLNASAVTDPIGANSGTLRVHRGGSWLSNELPRTAAAYRFSNAGESTLAGNVGFRVCVVPL